MQTAKFAWTDFKVKRWVIIPTLIMLLLLLGAGVPVYLAVSNAMADTGGMVWHRLEAPAGIAFYCAMLVWLLHVVFRPFLLRFAEEGVWRFSVFGRELIHWNRVKRAYLGTFKNSISLYLNTGGWFPVKIPLDEYKYAAILLEEIKRRFC